MVLTDADIGLGGAGFSDADIGIAGSPVLLKNPTQRMGLSGGLTTMAPDEELAKYNVMPVEQQDRLNRGRLQMETPLETSADRLALTQSQNAPPYSLARVPYAAGMAVRNPQVGFQAITDAASTALGSIGHFTGPNPFGNLLKPAEVDPEVWSRLNNQQRMGLMKEINQDIANETPEQYQQHKDQYITHQQMEAPTGAFAPGMLGLIPGVVPVEGDKRFAPFRGYRQAYDIPGQVAQTTSSVLEPIGGVSQTFMQPGNLAMLGTGMAAPTLLKALAPVFAASMVQPTAEGIQQTANSSGQDAVKSGVQTAIDALFLGAGAKYAGERSPTPIAINPNEVSGLRPTDLDEIQGRVPVENRLPLRSQSTLDERTQRAQGTQSGPSGVPFITDLYGRTVQPADTTRVAQASQMDVAPLSRQLPEQSMQSEAARRVEEAKGRVMQSSDTPFVASAFGQGLVQPKDITSISQANELQTAPLSRQIPERVGGDQSLGTVPIRKAGPFVGGATDVTGNKAPVQPTREMMDLNTGLPFPRDAEEARLAFAHLSKTRDYAARDGDEGQLMSVWKQMEQIKNKFYGGKTPPEATPEEVHQYVQGVRVNQGAATESRLHSGVDWKAFKESVGATGGWMHQAVKLMASQEGTGVKDPSVKIDGSQLWNRVKNKLGAESSEVKMWKDLGIEDKVKGEKLSPTELAQWMIEKGPKVEVRKFGAGNKSESEKKALAIEHQLDGLTSGNGRELLEHGPGEIQAYLDENFAPEKHKELKDLYNQFEGFSRNVDTGQSHWQSIAPKSESDMPGYVEIAVVKPHNDKLAKVGFDNKDSGIQFPSSHNFPPNTLGFVRGYMENVGGKKVFHVIEVQSDWAQQQRESQATAARDTAETGTKFHSKIQDDPLLPHYERLALKAAIEHARAEGADAIVLSDAETAMMTEGHDRLPANTDLHTIQDGFENHRDAQQWLDNNPKEGAKVAAAMPDEKGKYVVAVPEITQAAGMRLHYDQTLPKILSELTGGRGERAEMGEHRMAHQWDRSDMAGGELVGALRHYSIRKDLIFRNPDGTPKTSVSGHMYDISKPSERLTNDEPMSPFGKTYSGVPLPDLKKVKEIAASVGRMFNTDKLANTMAYMKDATSNLVTKNANEAASSIEGELQRTFNSKAGKGSVERNALSFVVEADGDKRKLDEYRTKIEGAKKSSDRAQAFHALQFATKNFDRLAPVAKKYSDTTEAEAQWEEKSGRKIERRKGYVMHLAEDQGDASSFIHAREYDTFADRIAAGKPVGSLDSVELLRSRVARGQQIYVQGKVFLDNVRGMKSASGEPVIGEYNKVERGGDHAPDYQVPQGYKEVKIGYNTVPVLDGYAQTLEALTSPSLFSKSELSQALIEARGVAKHIMLGFDTFHLGRLAGYGVASNLSTGKSPTLRYARGVTLLDNSIEELTKKAEAGQLDKAQLPQLLEDKRKIDLGMKTGFNVGRVVDAFNQRWVDKIPVLGHFQSWLFNTFQRGVMTDVYLKAWDAYKAQMPNATDARIARQLSKDLNDVFGTRGRQGLVKSRSWQDAWSVLLLAPQWTEGRIATEIKAVGNVGTAAWETAKIGAHIAGPKSANPPTRPFIGMQARVTGTLILMYALGNQLINMATTGHPTTDNEKGHELDAFIPDKISGSKGYWLTPTANAMETFHAMHNSLGRTGGDAWQAWLDYWGGRLGPLAKTAAIGVTGKQYGLTGPDVPPVEGEKAKFGSTSGKAKFQAATKSAIPLPIGTGDLMNLMRNKVDQNTERSILARIGMKVDAIKTPKQKSGKTRY